MYDHPDTPDRCLVACGCGTEPDGQAEYHSSQLRSEKHVVPFNAGQLQLQADDHDEVCVCVFCVCVFMSVCVCFFVFSANPT